MEFCRYHFPDLKKTAPDPSGRATHQGPPLEPVFQAGCTTDRRASDGRPNESETEAMQVREKGYAEGYRAGKQEGIRTAQGALKPGLTHFVAGHSQLAALAPQLADITADQVLALARDLTARITGSDLIPAGMDDQDRRQQLVACIAHAFRLNLHMNAGDIELMRELAENNGVPWLENCEGITITGDADQMPGQVSVEHATDELLSSVKDLSRSINPTLPD